MRTPTSRPKDRVADWNGPRSTTKTGTKGRRRITTGSPFRISPADAMTVLVLAQELDRTADEVIQGLTDLGEQVMRVDLSWFPQQLTLDAEFHDGTWHGCLSTQHHAVDLATIQAIWVRSPSL